AHGQRPARQRDVHRLTANGALELELLDDALLAFERLLEPVRRGVDPRSERLALLGRQGADLLSERRDGPRRREMRPIPGLERLLIEHGLELRERARRVRFDILSGFRGHDSGRLYHSIVLPAHPSGILPPRPVLDAACLDAACQRALGPEGPGLTAPLPSAPPRGSPGAPEIRERAAGRDVAGAPDDGAGGMRPRAARIEARDGERV